jgi:hypothetical protein
MSSALCATVCVWGCSKLLSHSNGITLPNRVLKGCSCIRRKEISYGSYVFCDKDKLLETDGYHLGARKFLTGPVTRRISVQTSSHIRRFVPRMPQGQTHDRGPPKTPLSSCNLCESWKRAGSF